MPILDADRPLNDPALDRLGYAPFAKHLAKSIVAMAPGESIVLAIHGEWGLGKSTALNFVANYLSAYSDSERPTIVRFNPWWFSGHERLAQSLFSEIGALIQGSKTRHLREKLADFGDLISELPLPGAKTGKAISRIARKSITEQKDEIDDGLKKSNNRLVIMIDDIDRLTSREIQEVFKLVISVANFHNIIYILAFDRKIVSDAISDVQGSFSGESYIKKIVQLSFDLPAPDPSLINGLFSDLFNEIIFDIPDNNFDQMRSANLFFEGVAPFLRTPRDVARLINSLRVTFPAIRGETNAIDMLGIETLRVFCPSVYDVVRRNSERFTGRSDRPMREMGKKYEEFYNELIEHVPGDNIETVKRLLVRLFPRLSGLWGSTFRSSESEKKWRRELRVCSPEYFAVYFTLSLPPGGISVGEINQALGCLPNVSQFASLIGPLRGQARPDGRSRANSLLDRLGDHVESEIASEDIASAVECFFKLGDKLWIATDEPVGLLGVSGNHTLLARLVFLLLRQKATEERNAILENAIRGSTSVSFISYFVVVLDQEQGRFDYGEPEPTETWLVSSKSLDALELLAVEEIRKAANDGRLIKSPRLAAILHRWSQWGENDEVLQWVRKSTRKNKGLAAFLASCVQKSLVYSDANAIPENRARVPAERVSRWLDLDEIESRVREISRSDHFGVEARSAASLLLTEMEILAKGGNPEVELG